MKETMQRQSDAELVRAAIQGNREAYAEMIRRYSGSVRAVGVRILGDLHAAEDVAQDTFIKAYTNLSSLRRRSAFGSWLLKIARREAIGQLRRRPQNVQSLQDATEPSIVPKDGRLDGQFQVLLNAVMKLPEPQRRLIMLRHFDGHSVRSIATILDRSVGTVTKQLTRAHRRLRNRLKEFDA